MKDHADKSYLRRTPRQHAVELYQDGYSWNAACMIAGYDEYEDNYEQLGRWLSYVAIAAGLITLACIVFQ